MKEFTFGERDLAFVFIIINLSCLGDLFSAQERATSWGKGVSSPYMEEDKDSTSAPSGC